MRGKGDWTTDHPGQTGITPAYAGKSCLKSHRSTSGRDHPRVCGEKAYSRVIIGSLWGSPPRMRGKEPVILGVFVIQGITPAHAGKRRSDWIIRSTYWDHPRVCGEKPERFFFIPKQLGSPRVCGEKLAAKAGSINGMGSPPRMRGKCNFHVVTHTKVGITPACAGKSSIQHLTASLGEFEVQKGHPVPHLRQCLQVWPDHARHLRHGLILHASRSAGQGRRLCPGPCPDTAGSGTPRGPSPAKRPHTSPPAATPGGCRAWQSGATAPGSR